jgi:hypothetical protein
MKENNKNEQPILQIFNMHVDDCEVQMTNKSSDTYIGYYATELGDQWIFTSNKITGEAVLTGGDTGWVQHVVSENGTVPDLVLSQDEMQWLKLCWNAATRFAKE